MERETGIEPASLAWKARVLPLNYSRTHKLFSPTPPMKAVPRNLLASLDAGGGDWIRTSVGVSQQIYSLPPLATRAPLQTVSDSSTNFWKVCLCSVRNARTSTVFSHSKKLLGAAGGDRTHDPWLRRPILYPLSYSREPVRSLAQPTTIQQAQLCTGLITQITNSVEILIQTNRHPPTSTPP